MTYEEYSEIRDSLGLKDGQVASATGIGRSTFSDWKSGRSCPKQEKMLKITRFLNERMGTPDLDRHEEKLVQKELLLASEDLLLLKEIHGLSPENRRIFDAFIDALIQADQQ